MNRLYQLAIVILIGACIWLYFCKSCTNPTIKEKARIDTVLVQDKEANKKIATQEKIIVTKDTLIEKLTGQFNKKDNYLREANKTATQLANGLVDAHIHHDTLRYERVCDSLGNAAIQWEINYTQISDSVKKVIALLKSVSKNKDSIITLQEQSRSRLISALTQAKSYIGERRKLAAGVEGYSTQSAFSSLQGGIMYSDKKDNSFGASAGFQLNGQAIFGLKYYHTISLHKK